MSTSGEMVGHHAPHQRAAMAIARGLQLRRRHPHRAFDAGVERARGIMVFGRVSVTVPSNSMTSSLAICFLESWRGGVGPPAKSRILARDPRSGQAGQPESVEAFSVPKRAVHVPGGHGEATKAATRLRNSGRGIACAPSEDR